MTLPNRPGYEVRERRPPQYWLAPQQSNNNSPPPTNSLPSTPPLQDQHLASLFPFLSAPIDTLKSEKILKPQLQGIYMTINCFSRATRIEIIMLGFNFLKLQLDT